MYRIENVRKVYERRGESVTAFCCEHLEIRTGEYVAIIGPSGSGKTTLLSLLGGMLSPTSGRVWFDSRSLYELAVTERTRIRSARMGFVFQSFNLIPYLTALQNVQVPLFLTGISAVDQRKRAEAVLERFGLGARVDHKPAELSIGQQQRVALARTLVNDPQIILADEPTGNLDPENRRLALEMLEECHGGGRTVVMVTHDPIAASQADRRLILHDGTVTEAPAGLVESSSRDAA